MRKQQGFTLIELLAVIVILALLALISSPIIVRLIDDAQKNAFKDTAYGLIRSAETECMKNQLKSSLSEREILFENYEMGSEKLSFSGKAPKSGQVYVEKNCQVSIAVHDGKWCAKKDTIEGEVLLSKVDKSECQLEIELGLNEDQLKCLIKNECEGITLPEEYIGTEGMWLPLSSRQDLDNIMTEGPAENMVFASGTTYEKVWNDEGYSYPNARFEQRYIAVKDFNMGENVFSSISHSDRPFCGVFDGNYNEISGLTSDMGGLFVQVSPTGSEFSECIVRNLNLTDVNINTSDSTGGLSGQTDETLIKNVFIEGQITGSSYVGGLIGQAYGTIIKDSHVDVKVTGEDYSGGLIGFYHHSEIAELLENVYAKADVEGLANVGGLIGEIHIKNIKNSYAEGKVTGTKNVGGLIGHYSLDNGEKIENVYTKVNVEGIENVGGLFGETYHSAIINAYAEGTVHGEERVGGLIGTGNAPLLENLYTTGSVSGIRYVGGLIGETYSPVIKNSYSSSDISGGTDSEYIGGFGGYMGSESIIDCYSSGQVEGNDNVAGFSNGHFSATRIYSTGNVTGRDNVGGLIGGGAGNNQIDSSYTTGNVNGRNNVGGFVGKGGATNINNSYAINNVVGTGNYIGGFLGNLDGDELHYSYAVNNTLTGGSNVGGLIGGPDDNGPPSTYSYWDTTISNVLTNATVGANIEVVGKTTNQMQEQSNYTNWDFTNTWIIESNNYPKLRWQN